MSAAASTAAASLPFRDLVEALACQHAALELRYAELRAEHENLRQELLQCSSGCCGTGIGRTHSARPEDTNVHLAALDAAAAVAAAPVEGMDCPQHSAREPCHEWESGDAASDPELQDDSPEDLTILPIWLKEPERDLHRKSSSFASVSEIRAITTRQNPEVLNAENGHGNKCFMIHPNSHKRVVWDTLAILILGYDVTMIPLMAFELPGNAFTEVMDFTATAFWTLDIGMSFVTGFWKIYAPEMRPWHVASHYVHRSFMPDILLASFDWTMYALKENFAHASDVMRLSKMVRAARIVRVLRLVRLARLPDLFNTLLKNVQSEVTRSCAGIARNLLLIILVNHFVACLWYTLRLLSTPSWADVLDEESRSVGYRYWTAMHWSITQFTPASMEVQPRNAPERCFAICMVFFGLVMFSSFVSNITTTMSTIRKSMELESTTKSKVMRYMSERRVSAGLGGKIANFVESYKFTLRPVHRTDIAIFSVLPKSLQLMLDWEVNQPVLTRHSLFHVINEVDDVCMLELCGAAEELSLGMCEELFYPGKLATKIFFTISGCLRCFHGFSEIEPYDLDCEKQQWICEPALWLVWRNRGHAIAVTTCSFLVLSSNAVQTVISYQPPLQKMCRIYAENMRDELLEKAGKRTKLEQQECDMFGDFGDDMDTCLEKAQTAFGKAEEVLRPLQKELRSKVLRSYPRPKGNPATI